MPEKPEHLFFFQMSAEPASTRQASAFRQSVVPMDTGAGDDGYVYSPERLAQLDKAAKEPPKSMDDLKQALDAALEDVRQEKTQKPRPPM